MAARAEIGDLEIGLLRTFLAVIRYGSLGKTASAIEMTQPAVSHQMLRLERIVGQKLFRRVRRGMALTTYGELLVNHAHRVIQLNQEVLGQFRGEHARTQITLGASADVALAGLAPILRRLQSVHPKLELRVLVTAARNLDSLFKSNELDLVIASPGVMTASPVARWSIALQWAGLNEPVMGRARSLPLVIFERPLDWQDHILDSLSRAGWKWNVMLESASLDAILTATRSGLGLTLLPREVIKINKLIEVRHPALPPAPKVQFGLFRGEETPSDIRQLLLATVDSAFGAQSDAAAA